MKPVEFYVLAIIKDGFKQYISTGMHRPTPNITKAVSFESYSAAISFMESNEMPKGTYSIEKFFVK